MTSGRINQFATHLWWPQSVTALTMHPEATPPGNHTRDMLQSKRFRMSLSPDSHDSLCLRYLQFTDYPSNVHKNTFVGKQITRSIIQTISNYKSVQTPTPYGVVGGFTGQLATSITLFRVKISKNEKHTFLRLLYRLRLIPRLRTFFLSPFHECLANR